MKRLFTLSVLIAALFTTIATNNIVKAQPASFTQDFLQEDYRNGEVVRTNVVTVVWDAEAQLLTLNNFYKNVKLVANGVVNLPIYQTPQTGKDRTSITWESPTKATFTWRISYMGSASIFNYTSFKHAVVCHMSYTSTAVDAINLDTHSSYRVNYKYDGGTDCVGTIDLEKGELTLDKPWGCCVLSGSSYSQNTGSRVIEYFERSKMTIIKTDLVDIVNDGTVGEEYTVNDDLVGVKVVDNMLFAKDFGKYKYPSEINNGQIDFLGKTAAEYMGNTRLQPVANFDQSNWVMLTGVSDPDNYVGKIIKGKSIKGTLVDKVNPTIAVSSNPEQGDQYGYEPNLYIMPSFNEAYYSPNSQFFFVAPKVQEYAYITWACYNAADGNFYTMSDGNLNNLTGGIKVNWDYYPDGNPQDGYVYEFDAIVRKVASTTNGAPLLKDGNQSTPVTGVLSDDYMVYPLRLYDVPTAINTVEVTGNVVNVKYYNLMGVESSTPFDGVNIVVTTYDNGSRITSKKLY